MSAKALTLSFDIGYASIGWCVLDTTKPAPADPEILGTGAVTFPTDDCLASKRRGLRRTRRHIRSTRQRIERMKLWLVHRGVLSRDDLDKPGHPAPFLLAAAALRGHKTLSAWELWTVLRWYAHNRGYDGNSVWSREDSDDDDTEKETNAKNIMAEHGTETMAETVCACLGLDPAEHATRISSALPYKTLNAAYPRETVFAEVTKLLDLHLGKISGLDQETIAFLLKPAGKELLTIEEKATLTAAGIKNLPRATTAAFFSASSSPASTTASSPAARSPGPPNSTMRSRPEKQKPKPVGWPKNSPKSPLQNPRNFSNTASPAFSPISGPMAKPSPPNSGKTFSTSLVKTDD